MNPSELDLLTAKIVAELRAVQRVGLSRIDPVVQTPNLLVIARRSGSKTSAARTALRKEIQRATDQFGDDLSRRTLSALFGLNAENMGEHPTTLKARAATIWGLEATSFRRQPMQTLLDRLSLEILLDLPEDFEIKTSEVEAVVADSSRPVSLEQPPQAQTTARTSRLASTEPELKLKIGIGLDNTNDYVICGPDGSSKLSRGKALNVGGGGAGTVYCAKFKDAQLRAIKFLTANYLDENKTGRRESDFVSSFGREIAILYKLSHGNIARLHDSGEYTNATGRSWPYLVTEFIAGPMLAPAIASPETTGEDIYRLFSEIISAVQYLHRNDVYHGDIKHENIKLRQIGEGTSEAVLLDLGAAHWLGPEVEGQRRLDDPDSLPKYRFISTARITHASHEVYRKGAVALSKDDLLGIMPSHDLHCLGRLLDELVGANEPKAELPRQALKRVLGQSGMLVLDEIIEGLLLAPETGKGGFTSIDEVIDDWKKLHPNYLHPAGIPELSLAGEYRFSLLTAVGRAVITPRLGAVINSKLCQHLRDVPQLEYTSLKFLGATHTRLSHSAAVYYNTRLYLAHLLNEARFRRMVDSADLQATLLLAFLHDIGHFQLSHMFEDFATDQRSARESEAWRNVKFDIPTDDDLFMSIVSGDDQIRGGYAEEILKSRRDSKMQLGLDQWGPEDGAGESKSLRDVITDGFGVQTFNALLDIHRAIYARRGPDFATPSKAHLVLGAIISSDIDADKTAYLHEDSARTGVSYGQGVDLDGILGNLCTPSAEDLASTISPMIGIARNGVTAAQSVAVNRNAMVTAVYWSRSNRAATAMVKFVIARLLRDGHLDMPAYIRHTFFRDRETAMLYLLELYKRVYPDAKIVPLVGLLQGERRLYKAVFSTDSLQRDKADEYSDKLLQRRYTDIITIEDKLRVELSIIPGLGIVRDGEVLLDVPFKERERPSGDRGGTTKVYERRPAFGVGTSLTSATPIMAQLKEQHRSLNRICRVFIAPHLATNERVLAQVNEVCRDVITKSIGA